MPDCLQKCHLTCCSWGWCPFLGPCQWKDLHEHTATRIDPGTEYPTRVARHCTARLASNCLTGLKCWGWLGYRRSHLTLPGPPRCPSGDVCSLKTRTEKQLKILIVKYVVRIDVYRDRYIDKLKNECMFKWERTINMIK